MALFVGMLSCAGTKGERLPEAPAAPGQPAPAGVYTQIIDKICEQQKAPIGDLAPLDKIVQGYLSAMASDGKFPDIDYSDRSRTNWQPSTHLYHLTQMALCYTIPASSLYGDPSLYDKIVKGLEAWNASKPASANWWYNQIDAPRTLVQVLVLMRSGARDVPQSLEVSLLNHVKNTGGDPRERTGANKTDVALHWLSRGCLMQDAQVVGIAAQEAYSVLEITTKEGIQDDGSYFQHGEQLYIGGYGEVLVKTVVAFADLTMGTPFAIPQDKITILRDFVLDTYLGVVRGQYIFFNVAGRGVSRNNALSQAGFIKNLTRLAAIDPAAGARYLQAAERLSGAQPADYGITASNTNYFRGDYMVHRRPGFSIGVRMVSQRTFRSEEGNGENTRGYFLSDGSTDIALVGNEYQNIFPTWDWAKIPGVTCPAFTDIPRMEANWTHLGESAFTGGVSDGIYGAAAYRMNNREDGVNTAARKSWFMFDREVVCLGSGIGSSSGLDVNTTLNQCFLSGAPTVGSAAGVSQVAKGETRTGDDIDWVYHNKVGYFFPQGGTVAVTGQTRTGKWSDINNTQSTSTTYKEVFTLWLEHGSNPTDAAYAYIVAPNLANVTEVTAYRKADNIRVLSNTANVQAVLDKRSGILQAVFYSPGTLEQDGIRVGVDNACIVMIRNVTSRNPLIYVSDPSHKGIAVNVDVKMDGKTFKTETFSFDSGPAEGGKTRSSQLKTN